MTVLVIEDDPVARRTYTSALAEAGFRVLAAEDGARGLELAGETDGPAILVVDWILPGDLDGLEVTRRVKSGISGDENYVILVTARTAEEGLLKGLTAGADDFATKPLEPVDLVARVRSGERALAVPGPLAMSVVAALGEAMERGDGEIVVRCRTRDVTGSIRVRGGRITWAAAGATPDSVAEILARVGRLSSEELATVLDESRRRGLDPSKVVAEWGLANEEQLRRLTRTWVGRRTRSLLALPRAEALFLPGAPEPEAARHGFTLDEISPYAALAVDMARVSRGSQAGRGRGGNGPGRAARLYAFAPEREAMRISAEIASEIADCEWVLIADPSLQLLLASTAPSGSESGLLTAPEALGLVEIVSGELQGPAAELHLRTEATQWFASRLVGGRVILVRSGPAARAGLVWSSLRRVAESIAAGAPKS